MCGILGYISNKDKPNFAIQNILSFMKHRGPDDSGVYEDDYCKLGMRRLSIIDLNTGHQPIFSNDKRYIIVLNGEIYNYQKIKKDLLNKGYKFNTETDTEVLLNAYIEYGLECLNIINGMYIFCIWDTKEKKCLLARDRCGIKPLYYFCFENRLYFASELKIILKMLHFKPDLDLIALNQYFTYGYIPSPLTPFKNIKKLEPGNYLIFDFDYGLRKKEYWNLDLSKSENNNLPDYNETKIELSKIIKEAVEMELTSTDVPIGLSLSGGIDSSALLVYSKNILSKPIKTFCFKFQETTHDESNDALAVALHCNSEHYTFEFNESDYLNELDHLINSLDEPFADPTYLTIKLLSREMKKHVKVALSGMGGDEIFTGYPTLRAHKYFSYYKRLPNFIRKKIINPYVQSLKPSNKYFSFEFKMKRFIKASNEIPELRHIYWMEYFSLFEKRNLLKEIMSDDIINKSYTYVNEISNKNKSKNILNRILYLDFKTFLENNGLFQADRASMAESLELRVPLLNKKIIDYMETIPFDYKMKLFTEKHLLKQIMKPYLPSKIINKKKKGFGPPINNWLKTIYLKKSDEILSKKRIDKYGILNYDYVEKLKQENLNNIRDNSRVLWMLITFQLWMEKYV